VSYVRSQRQSRGLSEYRYGLAMITVPDRCILLVEVDTMTSRRVISVVAGGADISVENVRWVTMCVCVCVLVAVD